MVRGSGSERLQNLSLYSRRRVLSRCSISGLIGQFSSWAAKALKDKSSVVHSYVMCTVQSSSGMLTTRNKNVNESPGAYLATNVSNDPFVCFFLKARYCFNAGTLNNLKYSIE